MLKITTNQLHQIKHHGEKTYPEECCGLLVGTLTLTEKIVQKVIPTKNSWNDQQAEFFAHNIQSKPRSGGKRHNFSIDPIVLLRVQKKYRANALDIVGIYHSHPDGLAVPSQFDRAIAWPLYSYLIIAVPPKEGKMVCSWELSGDRLEAEPLIIA